MNYVSTLLSVCLLSLSFSVAAQGDLTSSAQAQNKTQKLHDVQRESGFKQTEQTYLQQKKELSERKRQVQKRLMH